VTLYPKLALTFLGTTFKKKWKKGEKHFLLSIKVVTPFKIDLKKVTKQHFLWLR